jgi:hypothetical protein
MASRIAETAKDRSRYGLLERHDRVRRLERVHSLGAGRACAPSYSTVDPVAVAKPDEPL